MDGMITIEEIRRRKKAMDDRSEKRVTIRCSTGAVLELGEIGAGIRKLLLPIKKMPFEKKPLEKQTLEKKPLEENTCRNVVLSFADQSAWQDNPLYAGATLAPTAGRIAGGGIVVGGRRLQLTQNENNRHTLHGGPHNASFLRWSVDTADSGAGGAVSRVVFSCRLPDGLDGFPGNRLLKTIYTFGSDADDCSCILQITWEAVSDQDTCFNLSNHTYFNLAGDFTRPAFDHTLSVQGDSVIYNTPDFLPESIRSVSDTPFDYRSPHKLSEMLCRYPDHTQLINNNGYNHAFIFSRPYCFPAAQDSLSSTENVQLRFPSAAPCLRLTDPEQLVTMEAITDCPAMVLYSGGYFPSAPLPVETGDSSCLLAQSSALAFEFQNVPVIPGKDVSPLPVTQAGELWKRTTVYRFRWKE